MNVSSISQKVNGGCFKCLLLMQISLDESFFYLKNINLIFLGSLLQIEEDEKLKKRKERFGILTSAPGAPADTEVGLLCTAFVFMFSLTLCGSTTVFMSYVSPFPQAKKMKRAERFGIV